MHLLAGELRTEELKMGQKIKIKIGGIEYPLVAQSPDMEQLMRLAADEINQKLTVYDSKFPNKSLSDKLVFVALNEAINRISYKRKLSEANEQAGKLQKDVESYIENIEKSGR